MLLAWVCIAILLRNQRTLNEGTRNVIEVAFTFDMQFLDGYGRLYFRQVQVFQVLLVV